MEVALAVIGVFALLWFNTWNERRLARRIDRSMDKLMGRDDDQR